MTRQCAGSTGLIAEIVEARAREAFRERACRVAVTVTRACIARVHALLVSATVGAHEPRFMFGSYGRFAHALLIETPGLITGGC